MTRPLSFWAAMQVHSVFRHGWHLKTASESSLGHALLKSHNQFQPSADSCAVLGMKIMKNLQADYIQSWNGSLENWRFLGFGDLRTHYVFPMVESAPIFALLCYISSISLCVTISHLTFCGSLSRNKVAWEEKQRRNCWENYHLGASCSLELALPSNSAVWLLSVQQEITSRSPTPQPILPRKTTEVKPGLNFPSGDGLPAAQQPWQELRRPPGRHAALAHGSAAAAACSQGALSQRKEIEIPPQIPAHSFEDSHIFQGLSHHMYSLKCPEAL